MKLNRSMWRAVLAVLLVVLPLTALVIVPAAGAADPVLYSQADSAGDKTASSRNYAAPGDTLDALTADDFVVPAGAKWQITQVDVRSPSAAPASLNIFIYNSVASKPGTRIYSATGITTFVTDQNEHYSISLPSPATLTEGYYWLAVQANLGSDTNVTWGWRNRVPQTWEKAQFLDEGGASSTDCDPPVWDNRISCQFFTGGEYDQIFTLFGLTLPNLPPVNTAPATRGPIADDAILVFSVPNGFPISVVDPDAGTADLQVTLSVLHGTLTLATTTGLNFACSGCGPDGVDEPTMTFRGNLTEINNALNGLNYIPTDGFGGVDTLTITTNDRGSNGTGGAMSDTDTVAITVKARTKISGVSGTVQYGGTGASLNACLGTVSPIQPGTDLSGQTITFKVGSTVVGTGMTNSAGCANFSGDITNPGLNAGSYANKVAAEFAGSTYLLPSSGTGTLTVQRRILWVKPVDRTVQLKKANPPTDPHLDPANCAAPSWCLELSASRGSTFAPGESFANLNLANLRFQYARNPPSTNASEYVGKTYRITASGVNNANYDIRYDPGTMTVVPVAP